VSEVDENRAVVQRWIETFNNPYTPQTEVDKLIYPSAQKMCSQKSGLGLSCNSMQ
jgi:hypothetical protein